MSIGKEFRLLRSLSAAQRAPRIATAIKNIETYIQALEAHNYLVREDNQRLLTANQRLLKAMSHDEAEGDTQ